MSLGNSSECQQRLQIFGREFKSCRVPTDVSCLALQIYQAPTALRQVLSCAMLATTRDNMRFSAPDKEMGQGLGVEEK